MLGHLVATAASALALAHAPATHGLDAYAPARSSAPRAALNLPWCGSTRSTDDTTHQVDNGRFRYHAILAVPADRPVRLRRLAPQIQADAFAASALLERRYGRAIRFDLGTRCGPQYLDISVVRLRRSAGALRAATARPDGTLQAVYDELATAGFPVTQPASTDAPLRESNYVVWLDGPAAPGACGQATLYDDPRRTEDNRNNMGGSVGVVFREAGGGFCDADAVRHEIGHTLGAVQPHGAPHADPTGHCGDAMEDTMCMPTAQQVGSGNFEGDFFDFGTDDYWDPPSGPPLPWWTANLSRFLCPTPACNKVARKRR